jgi:rhodanese-related sulfurtransferase
MFNIFFKKKESDLNGQQFKTQYTADKGNVLLDVRTVGEYQSGSIKGAKSMDVMARDFINKMEKLDKAKTYYVYCRSGNRSGNAVSMLEKSGFKAYNLVGGISAYPNH